MYLKADRDRGASGECPEGGAEAAVGQGRGVDAAGGLAQLLQRAGGLGDSTVELRAQFGRRGLRRAQLQREGDEALLSAVVQVPLDPAARMVAGRDDPRACRTRSRS
jgi:hypothetical protein